MLSIRPATAQDAPLLETMIHELGAFEKLPVKITAADLLRDGFGASPKFEILIAEWDGQAAGYALFFEFYSSFEGRARMFLEDIYIRDQHRGKGIGRELLARVAALAEKKHLFGVCWEVLDWNTRAIDFYTKIGARFMDEWRTVSLEGEAFRRLAESAE